ncbi:hypothetical protein VPNG_05900 [Cytospora leucostoma]|uniref:Uncharacterized protein n=1 Tax=Cytospora leucostoma TaxID=1230097 RepID=A0A423X082_9PEZI|nr:hypothetical protein VPNG_05900 [Cytospora leucostoma]
MRNQGKFHFNQMAATVRELVRQEFGLIIQMGCVFPCQGDPYFPVLFPPPETPVACLWVYSNDVYAKEWDGAHFEGLGQKTIVVQQIHEVPAAQVDSDTFRYVKGLVKNKWLSRFQDYEAFQQAVSLPRRNNEDKAWLETIKSSHERGFERIISVIVHLVGVPASCNVCKDKAEAVWKHNCMVLPQEAEDMHALQEFVGWQCSNCLAHPRWRTACMINVPGYNPEDPPCPDRSPSPYNPSQRDYPAAPPAAPPSEEGSRTGHSIPDTDTSPEDHPTPPPSNTQSHEASRDNAPAPDIPVPPQKSHQSDASTGGTGAPATGIFENSSSAASLDSGLLAETFALFASIYDLGENEKTAVCDFMVANLDARDILARMGYHRDDQRRCEAMAVDPSSVEVSRTLSRLKSKTSRLLGEIILASDDTQKEVYRIMVANLMLMEAIKRITIREA